MDDALFWNQAWIERFETCVARYEKLKGKMDDEIKRAGLESLVPEELEYHLIFNSDRVKTFEDARSEIVTYLEEKIGLRIRKPSEAGFCERSDPTDVGVVSSLLSGKGKRSSDSRSGCFNGDATHFHRDCNACKHMNKRRAKAIRASHGPCVNIQSQAKEKVKRTKENPKDCPEEPRVRTKSAKGSCEGKPSETDTSWIHEGERPISILRKRVNRRETSMAGQCACPTILSRDAVPIGDDIEPVGEPGAEVEIRNEEEES